MKYKKKILTNGLTIILAPMKNSDIISVGFFVKVGAANENAETNGIAHFLEHLTFKGTKSRPGDKIFRELDMLGVEYNAATSMETTHYYMHGNSSDTKKILDIALDMYINPVFNSASIEKERKVIIEEMRMRYDMPYMQLHMALHQKMFKNTPYARPIIGSEKTIMSFKKKDFVEFRESTYMPQNTIFVVCGNFNTKNIYDMIYKPLSELNSDIVSESDSESDSDIESDDKIKEQILSNMNLQTDPFIHLKYNASIKQAYVMLAFPLFDLYDKYSKEIDLMGHILTSGSTSRLFDSLRLKKGITYSSIAFPYIYSKGGFFMIKSTMHPNEFITGLKIILRELKKLKNEDVSKEELTKAKNISINESLFSLSRPTDFLTYFGMSFLEDRHAQPNLKQIGTGIKKVKASKIKDIANMIFLKSKLNLYLYGNIKHDDFSFIKL